MAALCVDSIYLGLNCSCPQELFLLALRLILVVSFSAAFVSWCRDPSFHVVTTSLFRLCFNIVLYHLHFCHDKGLLPLSLTSCCSFVLMLRHDFLVLSIFAIATWFSCRDKALLCSVYPFCRDLVCYVATELPCIMLKPLS